MRNSEKPKSHKSNYVADSCVKTTHPAYGIIRMGQPQGHKQLFGSEVDHHQWFEFEILPAYTVRQYHEEKHVAESGLPIISFSMSGSQFVQMMMSAGNYSGVPVTLNIAPKSRNRDCEHIANIDNDDSDKNLDLIKKELFDDLCVATDKARDRIKLIQEAVAQGKGKRFLNELISGLDSLVSNLPSNGKFAVSQAQEAIEKEKSKAKTEIDGYAAMRLNQIAKDVLVERHGDNVAAIANDIAGNSTQRLID
ncbi:hypothetical protein [Acinetobacter phage HFM1]|nr:hypothetical protein [Acinetobacter phage HFM1]